MQINRRELLRFFDETPYPARGRDSETFGASVSAVTGLIGEELVLNLFLHYWKRNQSRFGRLRKLDTRCRSAIDKCCFDAWLVRKLNGRDRELFQVEVKNWSYHSVNMKRRYAADMPNWQKVDVAQRNWIACIERNKSETKLKKVMGTMHMPDGVEDGLPQRPLLCIWAPVLPPNKTRLRPFFKFQCPKHPLNGLRVFSASLYLHSLTTRTIGLTLNGVRRRLQLMQDLGVMADRTAT